MIFPKLANFPMAKILLDLKKKLRQKLPAIVNHCKNTLIVILLARINLEKEIETEI